MPPQATDAMGTAVAQLDGDITPRRQHGVRRDARAGDRGQRVGDGNVVFTDAATAAGMANSELAFKAEANDVIELGQLATGSDTPEVLFTVPTGSEAVAARPHAGRVRGARRRQDPRHARHQRSRRAIRRRCRRP